MLLRIYNISEIASEKTMKCPKCGSKFRVANTASTDDSSRLHLRQLCNELIQWYCQDYVVRQRVCTNCMYSTITVELERNDLLNIMRIIKHEKTPEQLEKHIGDKETTDPDK